MGRAAEIERLRQEDRAEASIRLKALAEPGKPVKTQIAEVAKRLIWPLPRTHNIWYRRVDVIAWEMDQLRGLTRGT